MNWPAFKAAAVVVLAGVLLAVGGLYHPGPDVLWTGKACPDPVVTCGSLPLGVIGAIALAVAVVEVAFGGERLGVGGENE